eukprot:TRINITY_DN3804_c0_g1_i2.p2 TRINITY_DN3804_c0_g1~~TRINITY_DN3804_c0_g1_i2.p2  ORF type:complete len:121 (+),score=35.31 TRINITY_DN3804_c0_g1_i2:218-580(+)
MTTTTTTNSTNNHHPCHPMTTTNAGTNDTTSTTSTSTAATTTTSAGGDCYFTILTITIFEVVVFPLKIWWLLEVLSSCQQNPRISGRKSTTTKFSAEIVNPFIPPTSFKNFNVIKALLIL